MPRIRSGAIRRTRLLKLLEEGTQGTLTLVTAPAGFGKTTLVSHWIQARDLRAAWVSLDSSDNHPSQYWTYLIHSIQSLNPDIGRTALQLLESSQVPSFDSILTGFLNDVIKAGEPLLLVVDDYHLITHSSIHSTMMYLLDHAPEELHVIIISRATPALPVARLRASGDLTEIGVQELRATSEETESFLKTVLNLTLSSDAIKELERQTEGWLAGLQLAALSLRGRNPSSDMALKLAVDNRYVLNYLTEEVLARQPEVVRQFLLDTSVFESFDAEMCDAITQRQDSQQMLEYLEAENLFLIPLNEQGWYRYHALFAELLRQQLEKSRSDDAFRLMRRAGEWLAQKGRAKQAITYFLAANEVKAAAAVIEQVASRTLDMGQTNLLMSWLEALPDEVILARPSLCFAKTWVLLITGHPSSIPELLDATEQRLQNLPDEEALPLKAELVALKGHLHIRNGDLTEATRLTKQALKALPEGHDRVRGHLALAFGMGCYHQGRWLDATLAFDHANVSYDAAGSLYGRMYALLALGDTERLLGRLREASRYYTIMIEVAVTAGRDRIAVTGHARIGLAKILCDQYDLQAAHDSVQLGLEVGASGERDVLLDGSLTLSLVQRCLGDFQGALETLDRVEEASLRYGFPRLRARAETFRTQIYLIQGHVAEALAWRDRSGIRIDDEVSHAWHFEHVTLARILFVEENMRDSLQLLRKLEELTHEQGRLGQRLEVMVLQSLCLHASGKTDEAVEILVNAIVLAQNERYVRPFVQDINGIEPLLHNLVRHSIVGSYARFLLQFAGSAVPINGLGLPSLKVAEPDSAFPLEPLSDREKTVLRLLFGGMTNKEIAKELSLSVNTVKTHVRNVYEKLGVSSRAKLVARVNELRLLE